MTSDTKEVADPAEAGTTACQLPRGMVRMLRVISTQTRETHAEILFRLAPELPAKVAKAYRKTVAEINKDLELGGEA